MAWKPKTIDHPPYHESYVLHFEKVCKSFVLLQDIASLQHSILAKYTASITNNKWYIDCNPSDIAKANRIPGVKEIYITDFNPEQTRKDMEQILELIPVITEIHFNLLAWQKEKTNHEL